MKKKLQQIFKYLNPPIYCKVIILLIVTTYSVDGHKNDYKIGSFNIQIFGKKKFNKKKIILYLIEIAEQYDILAIQEFRDASSETPKKFLNEINKQMKDDPYDIIISERLGRTSSKEQYAFLYKRSRVEVLSKFQSKDFITYERPPYAAHFRLKHSTLKYLVLITVHLKPNRKLLKKELQNIPTLIENVQNHLHQDDSKEVKNGFVMGDFNADCMYLSDKDLEKMKFYTNTDKYTWWLKGNDSTVGEYDCLYDRIVSFGENLGKTSTKNFVVKNSAKVNKYENTDIPKSMELKISDHYPVEISLEGE